LVISDDKKRRQKSLTYESIRWSPA